MHSWLLGMDAEWRELQDYLSELMVWLVSRKIPDALRAGHQIVCGRLC